MPFLHRKLPVLWLLAAILLSLKIGGCGGGSDDDPAPEPEVFYHRISNIISTNSVVVFAVEVADGRYELFSVDPVAGTRSGIADTFSALNGLSPVALNADASYVGYRADRDNDGIDELYSNLVDGSNEVLLTNEIATATVSNQGSVVHQNWQWLDNQNLIFRSDPDDDDINEIQSIARDASGLVVISGDLSVTCLSSQCWKLSNDSSVITFLVEATNANSQIAQSFYRVSADGSNLVQLNQTLADDSRINDWQFAADDSLLAYISQNIGSPAELYTVTLDGATRNLISGSGQSLGVQTFAWSPDNSRLGFTEDAASANNASLYLTLADGTERVHLIDTFDVSNPVVSDWQWSPDSNRLAYRANQQDAALVELFTVETDGQWHRQMNPPMAPEDIIYDNWQWSPDGNYLSFFGEFATSTTYDELYISAADGSQVNLVNVDLSASGRLQPDSIWTADASRLVYQVSQVNNDIDGIYSVLANGSGERRVSQGLTDSQTLFSQILISPDNSRIAYQIVAGGERSLHLADINGNNRVNVATVGVIEQVIWLPDSSRLLYVKAGDEESADEFYSVLADGSGRVKLY